jgi:hypothetical protein
MHEDLWIGREAKAYTVKATQGKIVTGGEEVQLHSSLILALHGGYGNIYSIYSMHYFHFVPYTLYST